MRVLHYALGGGLGHLVRAGRFLRRQGLADGALVLGTSRHVEDARLLDGIASRRVPQALERDIPALRGWLAECIARFAPELVCVDCFPAGLLGELADFPALHGLRRWHLARLLRWDDHAPLVAGAPRYELAWRLEPLHPGHEDWLRGQCDELRECHLDMPLAGPVPAQVDGPFWLVAHSGPADEVRELLDMAQDMRRIEAVDVRIVVASLDAPPLPAGCVAVDSLQLAGHYAAAGRIFGAAGFNFMAETEPWREKRVVLPFPRRFDDQFERARRASRAEQNPGIAGQAMA